jgi:hypothetical protein
MIHAKTMPPRKCLIHKDAPPTTRRSGSRNWVISPTQLGHMPHAACPTTRSLTDPI